MAPQAKTYRSRLLEASDLTVATLVSRIDETTGKLKINEEFDGDLAVQFHLPTLLLLSGKICLAQQVLNNIKKSFQQPDGDFISHPDLTGLARKTHNRAWQKYWPYMNGWIAMAAHRLSRFDISVPARAYLERFYNPELKGYGFSKESLDAGKALDVDIFVSAHLGMLALYFGDIAKAKDIGDTIGRFVAKQPDLDKHFLLRMSADTGELITQYTEDCHARLFRVSRTQEEQLHFLLAYPIIFLCFLHRASDADDYLRLAEKIFDFVLSCDESLYTWVFSHKLAYGAGLLFAASGKAEYRVFSDRFISYLLAEPKVHPTTTLPLIVRLELSMEIATWLREFVNQGCC